MCLWCHWKDLDEQDLVEFSKIGKIWIQMWEIFKF